MNKTDKETIQNILESYNDIASKIEDLHRYLNLDKFSKDTTVQANDIFNRLPMITHIRFVKEELEDLIKSEKITDSL